MLALNCAEVLLPLPFTDRFSRSFAPVRLRAKILEKGAATMKTKTNLKAGMRKAGGEQIIAI
jgi:hypothetical protein